MGRIETFDRAVIGAEDLQALEETYGSRYLVENDRYFFGSAHVTDVQLPSGADDSLVERYRSPESMFGKAIDSFNLVAATG